MTNETANQFDHAVRSHPAFKIRWVDEWDNPDGSIERGYAGRSIFFENGNVRAYLAPSQSTAACWPPSASTASMSTM